jgi:endonuclease/exonuclease/phosphatase family metal-dependent hydrolase
MRFLLYNIRYATGSGTRFHLPVPYAGMLKSSQKNLLAITEFIKSVQPDITGLVEVDCGSFRMKAACQAATIAEALNHAHLVEPKYANGSLAARTPILRKQGNALISSQQFVSHHFHYFNEGVKRLVIEAELPEVTVFLVHLALKYRYRQHQLEYLYCLLKKVTKPVIVAGDFNCFWGSRELNLFLGATGLKSANEEERPSHPSKAPHRQLDFILHSPELRVSNFYIPEVHLSDHAPLVCDFELP